MFSQAEQIFNLAIHSSTTIIIIIIITMSNLHDFLMEHAKFPFPQPNEGPSAGTTDVSPIEVHLLKREWKANHAVRDNTLVQKLCSTLENILGDTFLAVEAKDQLLSWFSARIQRGLFGREESDWTENPTEFHVSVLSLHSRPINSC